MAKSTRARYTQDFKFEAVRLVKGGQGLAVTAKILGISDQTLHNGIKADRQGRLKGSEAKPVSAEQMEIARLRAAVLVHISRCTGREQRRIWLAARMATPAARSRARGQGARAQTDAAARHPRARHA